jgi:hypothetical protein
MISPEILVIIQLFLLSCISPIVGIAFSRSLFTFLEQEAGAMKLLACLSLLVFTAFLVSASDVGEQRKRRSRRLPYRLMLPESPFLAFNSAAYNEHQECRLN